MAILLLAALLRLYLLDDLSLWTDEFFSIYYPKLGFAHLWGIGLRTEPTSPVYYSLIAGLERVAGASAGASAAVVRLPSVLASVASVALAWALGRTLFAPPRSATLAALLLALAPTNLLFAQEARAYALQGAALGLAWLGLAAFMRRPGRGTLLLYVVGGTAAMYAHPTSLLALAALNGAALFAAVGPRPLLRVRPLLAWCGAGLVILALSLPLLPVFLSPQATQAVSWIPPLSRWSIEGTVGDLLLGPAIDGHAALAAEIALPLLAALLLLPPWRPGRAAVTVLLVAPGLFVALMLGASLVRPILLTRTVAWLLIPLCVVLGDVLRRRGAVLAGAVVVVFVGLSVVHIASRASQLEDWRGLLARIDPAGAPLIVLAPHTSPAGLATYAPTLPAPVRLGDDQSGTPEVVVTERVFGTRTIAPADFAAAIAAHRRVWLIYRRPEYGWMRRLTAGLPPPDRAVQDGPGSNPNIAALAWN